MNKSLHHTYEINSKEKCGYIGFKYVTTSTLQLMSRTPPCPPPPMCLPLSHSFRYLCSLNVSISSVFMPNFKYSMLVSVRAIMMKNLFDVANFNNRFDSL